MAKSITVGKRENEKKRLAKREEKQKKKDSKKLSSKSSFDDMIAYVDENGMITSTPPAENIKKEEINLDEIIIATPKKEDEEPVILRGRVEFFSDYPFMHLLYSQLLVCQRVCLQNTVCLICK